MRGTMKRHTKEKHYNRNCHLKGFATSIQGYKRGSICIFLVSVLYLYALFCFLLLVRSITLIQRSKPPVDFPRIDRAGGMWHSFFFTVTYCCCHSTKYYYC